MKLELQETDHVGIVQGVNTLDPALEVGPLVIDGLSPKHLNTLLLDLVHEAELDRRAFDATKLFELGCKLQHIAIDRDVDPFT